MTDTEAVQPTAEHVIYCPTCKHSAPFHDGDPSTAILACDECGQRIAFGVAAPRIVIDRNGQHLVIRLSGSSVRDKRTGERVDLEDILVDQWFAKQLALNILSVT
jgi:transcription elongation factor Elf1